MEDEFDLGTGLTVITIVIDDVDDIPRVELGNCPPHIALQIFESAGEMLRNLMPLPTISFMGQTIAQTIYIDDDDEY